MEGWVDLGDRSSYRLHCMPSHLIASSPARCRVVRPPGNLDRGQSFTIWLIVCFAAPQLQYGSGIWRQRARFAAHCPWPVLKWFKFAHRCRGKLKPAGRAVESTAKDWLVTDYIQRWFIRQHTVTHPSTNPDSRPVDHTSDALRLVCVFTMGVRAEIRRKSTLTHFKRHIMAYSLLGYRLHEVLSSLIILHLHV